MLSISPQYFFSNDIFITKINKLLGHFKNIRKTNVNLIKKEKKNHY